MGRAVPRHPAERENPKRFRVFAVVGRQGVLKSGFSTIICARVREHHDGLATQAPVGTAEGLEHDSSIHCDELVSLPKSMLTNFVGTLPSVELRELNEALRIALELDASWLPTYSSLFLLLFAFGMGFSE